MSLIPCANCGVSIDPQEDRACIIVNPYNSTDTTAMCLECQERAYDAHQEKLMQDGPGPSLLEQQREAWRLK